MANSQLPTELVLSEVEGNNELLISIKNPTLAHFRHFSSLFTNFTSTFVVSALQIAHFMQNKANLLNAQMNVSRVSTTDYEKKTLGERGKNKPNSNPIKAKTNPIKANKMPKQSQYKPNTNPIKPNFKGKKMLHSTINTRRKSLGYYTDEIEAPNACHRLTKKYHGQFPIFICELFSRLDFDNVLDCSQIWESFGDRILRRTAKCGPTATAGGQLTKDKYFALEKAVSYKRKGVNHGTRDKWKTKSFGPRERRFS